MSAGMIYFPTHPVWSLFSGVPLCPKCRWPCEKFQALVMDWNGDTMTLSHERCPTERNEVSGDSASPCLGGSTAGDKP